MLNFYFARKKYYALAVIILKYHSSTTRGHNFFSHFIPDITTIVKNNSKVSLLSN